MLETHSEPTLRRRPASLSVPTLMFLSVVHNCLQQISRRQSICPGSSTAIISSAYRTIMNSMYVVRLWTFDLQSY